MTTDINTPAAPDDQDFDTAFAEVAAAAEKGAAPPEAPPANEPATPPAAPPVEPPATPPAPVTPLAIPPAILPAAPLVTPPVVPPPPAPPPPEPPKETPEQITAREALEASIRPYEPSDTEKAALAQFKKDFPNEYDAVEARLKSVDKDINARVYAAVQDVIKQVGPRLANVEADTSQNAIERHVAALHTAHPDFDVVLPKLSGWIKAQPTYLQPALQQVYDQGSTQDVIAMVADYKKATGVPAPAAPPSPSPAPPPDAADLTPVASKRTVTSPRGAPDPKDFDAGWDDAAAAFK